MLIISILKNNSKKVALTACRFKKSIYLCTRNREGNRTIAKDFEIQANAEIAQLVEHNLAKVGVA
ncbi:MAG: hypothetical protein MJZ31_06330, partial [Bacteroidales bacterium]|nr:hypothetical protein [Bacteroidales bacterium]